MGKDRVEVMLSVVSGPAWGGGGEEGRTEIGRKRDKLVPHDVLRHQNKMCLALPYSRPPLKGNRALSLKGTIWGLSCKCEGFKTGR